MPVLNCFPPRKQPRKDDFWAVHPRGLHLGQTDVYVVESRKEGEEFPVVEDEDPMPLGIPADPDGILVPLSLDEVQIRLGIQMCMRVDDQIKIPR